MLFTHFSPPFDTCVALSCQLPEMTKLANHRSCPTDSPSTNPFQLTGNEVPLSATSRYPALRRSSPSTSPQQH
ncbi:hypothetical protein L211DRAFT_662001 [Terfezia boudieri ATCC MYA-4762]|uniref:Uncharacterized protein n=1 Tax=Terfezia boudieri ATCC MYA-4762 TaxID=1051890 RepID=A0A3N4L8D3_9PEZI|nr:hypothetical protein L211DRAFT_662001 [Terfezia boudieri ATCC MYA-4762]